MYVSVCIYVYYAQYLLANSASYRAYIKTKNVNI